MKHQNTHLGPYLLSLPERVVRSATALAAGLAREMGNVLLPRAVRRTLLYQLMVDNTLRFLIQEVGEVEGVYNDKEKVAERFALRSALSHGIEFAGILVFEVSPLWVLAVLADLSGAGRTLIPQIAASLRAEGLLSEQDRSFESVDQLLDGLERTAGNLARAVNMPPLNIAELRAEWDKLKVGLPSTVKLPGAEILQRNWQDLALAAKVEKVSVFRLSSLLAMSAVRELPSNVWRFSRAGGIAGRKTGEILVHTILSHYVQSLGEIRGTGYLKFWIREYVPYVRASARQFSRRHSSLTEKLFRPK